ncbi:hypothetical protein ACWCPF_37860 [Streptomyces sp. NPDC001858]
MRETRAENGANGGDGAYDVAVVGYGSTGVTAANLLGAMGLGVGGSSPTRAQLNVGYEGRTYEDRWVVVDTKMLKPWPDHDRLRFRCDPARPAVGCPTPLGHHRWEFPILPGDDETYLTIDEAIHAMVGRYGIGRDGIEILRATRRSPNGRCSSAGSSPNGGVRSPGCATPCFRSWAACRAWPSGCRTPTGSPSPATAPDSRPVPAPAPPAAISRSPGSPHPTGHAYVYATASTGALLPPPPPGFVPAPHPAAGTMR